MLIYLIELAVVGLIAGGIARFLVPGPDPMGCFATALLGIAGAILGGFLGSLLFYHGWYYHGYRPGGFISAIVGSVILLLLLRLFRGRT